MADGPDFERDASRTERRGRPRWAAFGVLALCGLAAVLYGVLDGGKGSAAAACPLAGAETARLSPLVHGDVAALGLADAPALAPDLKFDGPDGRPTDLKAFSGKALLVNLWATWCVPCRKEMPALDALQQKLGGADFQVVAINVDTAKLDRPAAFLKDNGITALPLYRDTNADVLQTLKQNGGLLGLPTTLVVDSHGCELGRMAGPAEWASPDALALIGALKG